jgi:hypothetical protein
VLVEKEKKINNAPFWLMKNGLLQVALGNCALLFDNWYLALMVNYNCLSLIIWLLINVSICDYELVYIFLLLV